MSGLRQAAARRVLLFRKSRGPRGQLGFNLAVTRGMVYVVSTLGSILITRLLGPEEYGIYAVGAAVASVAFIFGPFGIDQVQLFDKLSLKVAQRNVCRVSVLTTLLGGVLALLWPGLNAVERTAVVAMSIAWGGRLVTVPWILDPGTRLDFRDRARRELRIGIVVTVVPLLGALSKSGLAVAVSTGLSFCVVGVATGVLGKTDKRGPRLADIVRRSWYYAGSSALYTVYFTVDAALLAAFRSSDEVGQYRVAYAAVNAAVLIPVVLNNDILRAKLASIGAWTVDWRRVLWQHALLSGVAGVAATALLIVGGPPTVSIVFGHAFAPAARLVAILGVAMLPHYLNSWAGTVLVGMKVLTLGLLIQAALVVSNVGLNVWLIPHYGASAAAWTTVATEVIGLFLYAITLGIVYRKLAPHRPDNLMVEPYIARRHIGDPK